MSELTCPQCGNPNLDVDAENSVVFCRRCGFAVHVDPQTGDVTPLSQGGKPGGAPKVYAHHSILGMDPLIFFMGGTAASLILFLWGIIPDLTILFVLILALALAYFKYR
jgi:ribosomal protein S27E